MTASTTKFAKRPLVIGGEEVPPGKRLRIEIPAGSLTSGTPISMVVEVVRGRKPGPRIWLSSTIHGDELNGIEIIREVLHTLRPSRLTGSVIAVPIVNPYGYLQESRYLPDRRDLNRSFPGSPKGSLASRLAHLFMSEIVARCDAGIDLHTGSDHRTNLPQIRADLDDPRTRDLALAFAPRVVVQASVRDGSLRAAGMAKHLPVLVFEGGEPHRFNRRVIAAGEAGVLRVLHHLGMIESGPPPPEVPPMEVRESRWIRAPRAGLLRLDARAGDMVEQGQRLGFVGDAFGSRIRTIKATLDGVVLGVTRNPMVNRGDAVAHIGKVSQEAGETARATRKKN